MLTPEYMHWLYTAFTRATHKVFLVNWPENQIEPDDTPPEEL
jgi:probable ATP-dependent exodeoxyribonuclease